jgi:hypothetical protein
MAIGLANYVYSLSGQFRFFSFASLHLVRFGPKVGPPKPDLVTLLDNGGQLLDSGASRSSYIATRNLYGVPHKENCRNSL